MKKLKNEKVIKALKKGLISFSLLFIFFLIASSNSIKGSASEDNKRIRENVTIAGVDVSGMTTEEAKDALLTKLDEINSDEITLKAGEKELKITPGDAGFKIANLDVTEKALLYGNTGNILERYRDEKDIAAGKEKDFSLAYTADASLIEEFLTSHQEEIETEKVNGDLKRENGKFVYIPGQSGTTLDVAESVSVLKNYLENSYAAGEKKEVSLSVLEDAPLGTEEELSNVKDVLGSYSTDFSSSSSGRAQNVKTGASRVNGHVVYPGETFSVGDAIHPCTEENGYTIAMAYENGQSVESMGGGICQVSTTMYNAVIRAELEVVTRSAHSMTVSYVKPSMDAAIADGSKDFKFKNNQDYPIYVEMYTSGGIIYANVYGKETRPANRKVTFESEILETTEPKTVLHADSSLPVGTVTRTSGSPHTGYKAQLVKVVTVDGVEESRKVFNNSVYRATDAVYSVGTKSDNPEAVSGMQAAIATQDLNAVKSAAASYSQIPTPAPAQAPDNSGADGSGENTAPATEAPSEDTTQQGAVNTEGQ